MLPSGTVRIVSHPSRSPALVDDPARATRASTRPIFPRLAHRLTCRLHLQGRLPRLLRTPRGAAGHSRLGRRLRQEHRHHPRVVALIELGVDRLEWDIDRSYPLSWVLWMVATRAALQVDTDTDC